MITCGISSYNFKQHVASDIGIDQNYLPSESLSMQSHLDTLVKWTYDNQMRVNEKKTKLMVINYTNKYQFATRLYMQNELLEVIEETKLLRCIISLDLKFHKNTEFMIQKAYGRMTLLHKLYSFNVPIEDLINIYILYIRSLVEQNVAVWSHTIT